MRCQNYSPYAASATGALAVCGASHGEFHCRFVTNRDFDGSFLKFFSEMFSSGPFWILSIFHPIWGAKAVEAWTWFVSFGVLQAALQVLVPGPTFHGPVSPRGNVPIYKVQFLQTVSHMEHDRTVHLVKSTIMQANGIQCFAITAVIFAAGSQYAPIRIHLCHKNIVRSSRPSLVCAFQVRTLLASTPV